MQTHQIRAPRCRPTAIGTQLEREILALRLLGAKLEEAAAGLTRPLPPLYGRRPERQRRRERRFGED